MNVQQRVEKLICKGTGCSEEEARRVALKLSKNGYLSKDLSTGYLIEQHNAGRWWRINGWIYNREQAINFAHRNKDHNGRPTRVIVIRHTAPRRVMRL